jgi:tetratricopeptide (TPR) repeat protein
LHSARELSRRYPDRRVALVLEARALALAEDTRALDSVFVAWDSLPTNVYWSQGAAMSIAGEELQRRGREVEGKGYSERAVKWLANRLVATPNDRAFRYWMGTTLYNMGRYDEARPYFEGLVRDFPDRMTYHGLAALTAARRGDTTAANAWLGTPAPRDTGEYLAFKARVAAIGGDIERAIALLTSAMDRGVDAYPWLRGQTFRDFAVLAREPRGRALLSGR